MLLQKYEKSYFDLVGLMFFEKLEVRNYPHIARLLSQLIMFLQCLFLCHVSKSARFKSSKFYQKRPKIKLFLENKIANLQALGLPPP